MWGVSKTIHATIFAILISGFSLPAKARNNFENSYQPTPREICEMNASPSYAKLQETCKSINLFKPFIESNFRDEFKKITVAKEKFPNWPFPDVHFEKRKGTSGKAELVLRIDEPTVRYVGDYHLELEPGYELVSVAIGQLDNFIVIQFKEGIGGVHTWYKQMIFTPQSCGGYEGYGDKILYHMTSSLGWSGAFTSSVYKKTYFSPPLCN